MYSLPHLSIPVSHKFIFESLMSNQRQTQYVDGNTLTVENLVQFSTGKFILNLTPAAWAGVAASRKIVQNILDSGEVAYGM